VCVCVGGGERVGVWGVQYEWCLKWGEKTEVVCVWGEGGVGCEGM